MDKRCRDALLGLLAVGAVCGYELADGTMFRTGPQEDKPAVEVVWQTPINKPQLLEAIQIQLTPALYRENIPLNKDLQAALWDACELHGVPAAIALGLIEAESNFQTDLVSSKGAYGLCQLNPKYFPDDLDPAQNITAGVSWLGTLLERYDGDTAAALRAYNLGYDDGDRKFADAVLAAAERWKDD